jgi:hypothetical protein
MRMRIRVNGVVGRRQPRKLVVEEDLEVSLWRLSMWLEDLVTMRLFNSFTRIRQVKTENPSTCVTVNCKLCKPAIALYCVYERVDCKIIVNKSNHPIKNPLLFATEPRTRDNIYISQVSAWQSVSPSAPPRFSLIALCVKICVTEISLSWRTNPENR